MPDRKEINKRGYLKEDFRLFHLKDSRAQKWTITTTPLTS